MIGKIVKAVIGDAPSSFDAPFFSWVERAQELAGATFVDLSEVPLSKDDRLFISSLAHRPIPNEIDQYYNFCSPWGVWREPRTVWTNTLKRISRLFPDSEKFLPVDINSQVGNILVARIVSGVEYHLVEIDRNDKVVPRGPSLWKYLSETIENEKVV